MYRNISKTVCKEISVLLIEYCSETILAVCFVYRNHSYLADISWFNRVTIFKKMTIDFRMVNMDVCPAVIIFPDVFSFKKSG